MIPPDNVRGLLRSEYEKLVEVGMFEGLRIELLDGQIVEKSPQSVAHSSILNALARPCYALIAPDREISVCSGFRAGMRSMPEPDLAIVPARYRHPEEALLVVEVADDSLRNDLGIKAAIYAAAGVPEYWVVDVAHDLVIEHKRPTVRGYQSIESQKRGATLRTSAVPMLVITVDDILDCT
ncbi:MAG TPA: Uma2 family endonuclease [Kofleriaceae bacterium]